MPTDDIDSAVLWSRRVDECERTLTLLLSRVAESRPNQGTFLGDLQMLTAFTRNLRDVLDSRTFRREFEVDGQEFPQTLRTTEPHRCCGKAEICYITESQIRMLRQEHSKSRFLNLRMKIPCFKSSGKNPTILILKFSI